MMNWTYAQAETVLAKIYKAYDEKVQRGAFRGRLKHLKRLGVPLGVNPGRGKKVLYTDEHVYQWAYCLELGECGLDPSLIVASVAADWERKVLPVFREAEPDMMGGNDHYLLIHPQFMSSTWTGDGITAPLARMKHIRHEEAARAIWRMTGDQSRAWVINVSEMVRQIGKWRVLVDSKDQPDMLADR